MPDTTTADLALNLVHQGWDHLRLHRPIAAWASWQRALRVEPGHPAARRALDVLANAGDLPEAARLEYRFLTPVGESDRTRWDSAFRGRNLEDLADAAEAFEALDDGRARFNRGLCLAWMGRNAQAVAALGLAVEALAESEPGVAVDAWTLAEILRQGAGAESLADDRVHAATIRWTPGNDPAGFLDARDDVRPLPTPVEPDTGRPRVPGARLYEWLDRPSGDVRRVLANLIRQGPTLRLSGPDARAVEAAFAEVVRVTGPRVDSIRREVTPLPLAFLDADAWAIRMPPGLDGDDRDRLHRAAIETYYENQWIIRPRIGLDGRSPVEAGLAAAGGDAVALARLSAVVRVREQLGARPSTVGLYQGYPFDRLRSRLGLPPTDPEAVDPTDASTMSGPELDRLDPSALDDHALADAFESASALGDDTRTARFAAVLAGRRPEAMARLDRSALFACLVRRALVGDDPEAAFAQLDRAIALDLALTGGRDRHKFGIWRAEVAARSGRPDASVLIYRQLLDETPDPALALDAAETLLDNGHDDHARDLARLALDLARGAGDDQIEARAEALI